MYYVYEFFIVDTDEIIYVGKGKGNRYKVKSQRNKFLTDMLKRFDCDSRIVKTFDNEKDAFLYEHDYIEQLKSVGQCVCNIYSGGAGGYSEYWTDELRKEYSEHNVMKSEYQRKRMSEYNPMKNPDIAEKVNSQKRKPVIINNIEYCSIKDASISLGVSTETIVHWCNKGINALGQQCRFKDKSQVEFTGNRYNKGNCRAVIFRGVEYESVIDFVNALGIGGSTAMSWLRRGFNPSGEPVRYKDDTREIVFKNRHVERNKARAKTVIVNDIEYRSCEDASIALNIPKSTLYSYLQNLKHNPKYICKYGNQHPSQTKSDNSSLEGSTTNR